MLHFSRILILVLFMQMANADEKHLISTSALAGSFLLEEFRVFLRLERGFGRSATILPSYCRIVVSQARSDSDSFTLGKPCKSLRK